MGEIVTRNM